MFVCCAFCFTLFAFLRLLLVGFFWLFVFGWGGWCVYFGFGYMCCLCLSV